MKHRTVPRWGRLLAPPVFWLAVWQGAAAWVGKDLLLPGPAAVARTLAGLACTPEFWLSAGCTLLRVFAGLAGGVVLGTLLAALTCASRWCELLLSPAIKIIRATPVASFILLVLLWVSAGKVPGVISALMVLPVVWGNVSQGVRQADPALLELAGAYRFGRLKTLRLVYIPAAAPYFAAGVETGLGLAWKAGVAAEVLCRPKLAVGSQVYFSKLYLETPSLFAWTLTVIVLSFLVEYALVRLLRKGAAYAGT